MEPLKFYGRRTRANRCVVRVAGGEYFSHFLPGNIDWGAMNDRAVVLAGELLVKSIGEPKAAMHAEEFAADVLRTLPMHGWILSADQVREWYRIELEGLKADAEAEYAVEQNLPGASS